MKTYRLYIMILASMGIHLGVLGFWDQSSQPIYVSTDLRSQNMNVTLNKRQPSVLPTERQVQKPKAISSPVPTRTASKSIEKMSKPHDKTKNRAIQVNPNTIDPPADANQAAKPASKQFAVLNNDMIKNLHSEFRARFKYPMLARKRGWQGEVVLALNINLQGKIANIVVKQSSGYKVLDHNAVKTFEAIGMISPNLHERILKARSFNIPIVYQLHGG